MKDFRPQIALFFVALTVLFTVLLLDVRTSRGQSSGAGKPVETPAESRVKPTAMVRDRRVESAKSRPLSSAFVMAAGRNAVLRNELNWLFGGRQQRGWYLYTPLIKQLLNTEYEVDSGGFASALASWQKTSGLKPSGVLDEESLYAMVSGWQASRLQNRSFAQPEQLVTASVSDFYDNERLDELRQVERETYAAYKRMVAAAAADPSLGLAIVGPGQLAPAEKYLKILSSFRTREYQEKLRRESPHVGRAGLAINSPHFTGRALDLYVGGAPVETKDANRAIQIQTRVYQWLVCNAQDFGFRPYYYEPWHWEYVGR